MVREVEKEVRETPKHDPERLAYNQQEVAQLLGVGVVTVWRLTKRGLLRPNRSTRNPLYSRSEIERFIEDPTGLPRKTQKTAKARR